MKTIKTYSVDKDIYEKFNKITKYLNMNKSNFFQEKIEEFVEKNGNKVEESKIDTEITNLLAEITEWGNFTPFNYKTIYDVVNTHMFDLTGDYTITNIIKKLKKDENLIFCINTDNNSIFWENRDTTLLKSLQNKNVWYGATKLIRITSDKGSIKEWSNKLYYLNCANNKPDLSFANPRPSYIKEWIFRVKERQFQDRIEFHPQFLLEDGWHSLLLGHKNFDTGFETLIEAQDFITGYKKELENQQPIKEIIHEI